MLFTALHRELGLGPGPLTDDMLRQAIADGVAETDDLDWKKPLTGAKDLATSDVPKDIAAMANYGGGIIVYGITEDQKKANGRHDVDEVPETYERTYHSVAVRSIHPPVFGLGFYRLGEAPERAVAVVVPPSVDVPHMVYRGEYFGAPIRNNADTVWMREPELERFYRRRLDDRRLSGQRLDHDYQQLAQGRDTDQRAWMIGVARPRIALPVPQLSPDDARAIVDLAAGFSRAHANSQFSSPLSDVASSPKPGLRRWVAAPNDLSERAAWKEAWASVHFDGSVSLAAAIGGGRERDGYAPGNQLTSHRAEWFVADLMGLIRAVGEFFNIADYELRIGIEHDRTKPLFITTVDNSGLVYTDTLPINRFIPVDVTVQSNVVAASYLDQVRQVASDVVNQAGIHRLRMISRSP